MKLILLNNSDVVKFSKFSHKVILTLTFSYLQVLIT